MQVVKFLFYKMLEFVKDNILNSCLVLLLYKIWRSFDNIVIKTEATELRFANYGIVRSRLSLVEKQALKDEIDESRMFLTDSFQIFFLFFTRQCILGRLKDALAQFMEMEMLRPYHQMLKCILCSIICFSNAVLSTFFGDALPSPSYELYVTIVIGALTLISILEYIIYATNIIKLRRLIKAIDDWEIKVTPATI